MVVIEPSGLYYPNRFARYFFSAMEDVMGKNGVAALLTLTGLEQFINQLPADTLERSFDFAYMATLSQGLEEMYGGRGGRGIALRIGRAWMAQGLKTFGALGGMSDPAFRALPLPERAQLGLAALGNLFTRFSDQRSRVETGAGAGAGDGDGDGKKSSRFVVEPSPMAWGRTADRPVCHALTGVLQEGLRWASNGYEYHVYETECRATGSESCVFVVNHKPIGQGVG